MKKQLHASGMVKHADEYLDYLKKSGIKDYKRIPGNLSIEVWRKKEKDFCHFWTVTKWKSYESIKQLPEKILKKPNTILMIKNICWNLKKM